MTRLHLRVIGVVSILTGLVVFAGSTLHIGLGIAWGHWLMVLGNILLVFTITGLYAVQTRQSGAFGLATYVLTVTGLLVKTATDIIFLADIHGQAAAREVWSFLYIDLPVVLPGAFAALVGLLLFGLVTAYSRVLPRWAGVILSLAAIINLPGQMLGSLTALFELSLIMMLVSLTWIGSYLLACTARQQFVADAPSLLPEIP